VKRGTICFRTMLYLIVSADCYGYLTMCMLWVSWFLDWILLKRFLISVVRWSVDLKRSFFKVYFGGGGGGGWAAGFAASCSLKL